LVWALQPVMAMTATNTTVTRVRIGRMALLQQARRCGQSPNSTPLTL
jgi:hypothetical protein